MLKIGTGELVIILLVALIIFGPSRLPALGKMVGKAVGTLRHYANTENWAELEDEEPKAQAAAPSPAAADQAVQEQPAPAAVPETKEA